MVTNKKRWEEDDDERHEKKNEIEMSDLDELDLAQRENLASVCLDWGTDSFETHTSTWLY